MREILFRGKRVDNGEWVYGFLSKSRDVKGKLSYCIDYEEKGVMCSSIVLPETVGQYIGFTDEDGIKIFEGDIIAMQLNCAGISKSVIEYECGAFVRNIGEQRKYRFEGGSHSYIIGNIHDNPELLEGVGNEVNNNESN